MNKETLKVAFLVSYDSYFNALTAITETLNKRAIKSDIFILNEFNAISKRHILDAGIKVEDIFYTTIDIFINTNSNMYDCIFLGMGGNDLSKSIDKIHLQYKNKLNRPKIITIFPGVTLYNQYKGMIARAKSDLILFNSRKNLNDYQAFCNDFKIDTNNTMLFGFPKLLSIIPKLNKNKEIKNVLFIDSSIVPSKYEERQYIAKNLVQYAKTFPNRNIFIQLRSKIGEKNAHNAIYCMEKVIQKEREKVKNIYISYDNIKYMLEKADLCFGMSSTVLIEAMFSNIPTAIISDFGLKEEFGNILFVGSKCFRSFQQLLNDDIPYHINSDWFNENISIPHDHIDELINKLSLPNHNGFFNENINSINLFYKESLCKKFSLLKKITNYFRLS